MWGYAMPPAQQAVTVQDSIRLSVSATVRPCMTHGRPSPPTTLNAQMQQDGSPMARNSGTWGWAPLTHKVAA